MAWSVVAKRNLHGSPSRFILRFARRCFSGEESVTIRNPTIGCSRVGVTVEGDHIGQAILRRYIQPIAHSLGIQKKISWHTFRHTYSTLLRSVGAEFKVMQELLRHSSLRSTLDVYTQAISPA